MKHRLEKTMINILRKFGYSVKKTQTWNSINIPNEVRTLVDVGVAHGTPELYNSFKFDSLLLVEPIQEYESDIRKIVERFGAIYEPIALGSEIGEVEINVNMDRMVRSSIYKRTELTSTSDIYSTQKVKIGKLDDLIQKHQLRPPYGIKIDTEGHELEVLKGSVKTLKDADFVITETSVQKRFEESYRFADLVCYMRDQGFSVSNILSAEADGSGLVRYMDILFIRQKN